MQTIVNLVSGGMGVAWVPQSLVQLQRPGVVYRAVQGVQLAAQTSRATEIAERTKRIELIDAARELQTLEQKDYRIQIAQFCCELAQDALQKKKPEDAVTWLGAHGKLADPKPLSCQVAAISVGVCPLDQKLPFVACSASFQYAVAIAAPGPKPKKKPPLRATKSKKVSLWQGLQDDYRTYCGVI